MKTRKKITNHPT
jgi:hypothetical protein